MKKLLFGFFILLFAISCKKGAAKLDINDVEAHRGYQDSLIVKSKISIDKLQVIRQLINEYVNLEVENKNNNSNYNYYLSRLYSYVNSLPMNGLFYDSTSKKTMNLDLYKNFYDSSIYYSELALKYDSNNIRAMSVYANTLFWQTERYRMYKKEGILLPHASIENNQLWNNRMNYLYTNFTKFSDLDTSSNKVISRGIFEHTFPYIAQVSNGIIIKGVDWSNDNDLYTLNYTGICIDFLNKFEPLDLDLNFYKKASKELYPYTRKAFERIQLGPIRNFLDKVLYKRGWSSTEHSLDGDIQTSRGGLIEYTNNDNLSEESEITFTLNSDFTYNMIFRPIRYISTVTVNGKWKFLDNNKIELEKDIFIKAPVTSADYPLSEEAFYEYILIPKTIQIINGYLVLDERSTNRNTFFVQLAIVQNGNNLNADNYALKSLRELSLEKDLLTQYLGYYK